MGVEIINGLTVFSVFRSTEGAWGQGRGNKSQRLSKHTHQELQESQDVEGQGCHALWSLSPDQETKTR